jgi:hypothetical protein
VLGSLLALALACRWGIAFALGVVGVVSDLAVVALAALLYTVICAAAVYRIPSAAGLTRAQVERALRLPRQWLHPAPQS